MNELTVIQPGAAGTSVALVDRVITKEVVFQPGGIEKILLDIEAEARGRKVDISTEKGRKACASLMAQIRSSKATLDAMGLELTEGWRTATAAVNADRTLAKARLVKLEAEVGAKLIAWRERDASRVAAHEAALKCVEAVGTFGGATPAASDLAAHAATLAPYATREWEEFEDRAAEAYSAAVDRLNAEQNNLATRVRAAAAKAEQAEADRVAREKAQADREAQIAKEAAEQATAQAEARAELERTQAAARAAADKAAAEAKVAADKAEAEANAARELAEAARELELAEIRRLQAEARAAADKAEAEARTERDRLEAAHKLEQAEQRRRDAEAKAASDAEAAVAAERERVAQAKQAEEAAERRRSEDKAQRQKVNLAARAAMISAGASKDVAEALIIAIAFGQIPNVTIRY